MNILLFNYEYPPLGGGGGVFCMQLAEELVKKNCKITVITSNFANQKNHEIINDVHIIRVPILMRKHQTAASLVSMLSYFPTSFITGYKCLKGRKYDLIHSMFAIPSAPSAIVLSKSFKIPHILSILGGDIYDPSKNLSPHKAPILRSVVQHIINYSDKVVALSNDIKNRALQHYCINNPIDIIHLGIPKPSFTTSHRSDCGYKESDILIVTVGRLVPRKGVSDLIKIVKQLGNINVKLIIIGDGPIKPVLEEQSRQLGIQDQIIFKGFVSDTEKFRLLSVADIYASTSMHEGFGIVFLEAMAAGLPIISYDKGGQSDFLKDGLTGYLVNYRNETQFIERLKYLCDNDNLRKTIKSYNFKYFNSFSIQTCAAKYFHQYQSFYIKK